MVLLVLLLMVPYQNVYATQSHTENFDKSYSLGSNQAENLVNVAQKQLGKSKANLGYTEAWCADFVCDCAKLTGMADNIIPYNYASRGACTYLYNYMVKNCSATPVSSRQKGDIIFYYCSGCGRYVHTGIVLDATYTIEGNYDGKVTQVKNSYTDSAGHKLSQGTITRKYLRPNYTSDPNPSDPAVVDWYYDGATDYSDFRPVIRVSNPETVSYVHFYVKYTGGEYKRYDGIFNGGNAWYCDVASSDLGEGGTTIECAAYVQGKNGNDAKGYPYVPLLLEKDDRSHDPIGKIDEITVSEGKIHIKGWVYDPDVTGDNLRTHVYVGGRAGENTAIGYDCGESNYERPDVNAKYSITGTHGFEYDIYTDLTGNQPVYVYAINKEKGQNVVVGYSNVNIPQDILKPEITNVEIRDKSPLGYTISCTVSDNVNVDRVQFPTWTQNNGQDDIFPDWDKQGTSSGNRTGSTYTYRVDVSKHNGETGKYNTHIYAFDTSGNCTRIPLDDIDLYSLHEYEHNLRLIEKEDATCVEKGLKIYACNRCGEIKREETDIDISNHTDNNEIRNEVEATCTHGGYTGDTYCKDCGTLISTGSKINKKEHVWGSGKVTQEPTCIMPGIKTYTCAECLGTKTEEIPATGKHENTEIRNAKESTCAEEGYTGDIYCKDCGTKVSTGQKIDKKEHMWDSGVVTIPPTCVQRGEKTYTCTVCHATKIQIGKEGANKNLHTWDTGTVTETATCTKPGVKTYVCTLCGETKTEDILATGKHQNTEKKNVKEATCAENGCTGDLFCQDWGIELRSGETIAKKPHTWDDGSITTAATCTEKGIKTYTCTVCNTTKTAEIPSTGHQHTQLRNAKEATCTEAGYTGDTYCTDCGSKLSSGKSIPKTDHIWDAGKVTKNATCIVKGIKTFTCTVCEATRTEEIPATGNHKNTELRNVKEATCTSEGYTGDTCCKDCGMKLSTGQAIAKTEHTWDAGKITQEATCVKAGAKTYTCTNCNTTRIEEIAATGHMTKVTKFAKEATCKAEGYSGDIYCQVCGTILKEGKVLPKTDHSWDEGKITAPAACTTAGGKTYTCTFCGTTKTEDIPATGHVTKVKKFTKDATCKTEGYSGDVYCQDCGALLEEGKVLPKVEHSWDEGQITTPATCMAEGVKTFTCTVCEETKSEKILAVGHGATEVRNRKDATCAAEGYTGDTYCTVCGEVVGKGETTAKTAHSWDAGKITKQPTTTETGAKTFTCQSCGLTRTETVAKLKVKKLTPGKIVKSKATNGVYKVLKDGRSVEFTKPIAKRASVKIANTIKINGITCKVTGISASAFKNNTSLRTVIIGKNVTSIGSNAFYGCKKLTRITGGSAVTKIGDKAFYNCSSLTSITIPAGVNKIGKMAFYNCKKLRTIVVKTSKLTSRNIGSKAFAGTYAKAAIKVPVKQLNTYKKLFKSKGMGPKAVYKK